MLRILMEDIDARADDVVRLHRQQVLEGLEGLDAGLVGVVDGEVFQIQGQDVDRHLLDHLHQPRRFRVGLDLLGDHAPGQHGGGVVALLVANGGDQQIEDLVADLDLGVVRQVPGIAQDAALVLRVLVKDVDARAQKIVGLDGQ